MLKHLNSTFFNVLKLIFNNFYIYIVKNIIIILLILSILCFSISTLCPIYIDKDGWLIEPCFGFMPIAYTLLFISIFIILLREIKLFLRKKHQESSRI